MKLVILDRDGVINFNHPHSVRKIDEFIILKGAAEAVALLNKNNFHVAIATNQSLIGRKIITEAELHTIHDHMADLLSEAGGHIDKIYFAPDHHETPGPLRKPNPGMLQQALKDFDAIAHATPFIGDSLIDIQAARRAGCIPVLVKTGRGLETMRHTDAKDVPVFDDVLAAAHAIVRGDVSKL